MEDVIVIAGATHREGFLDEYEAQLARASVPFHLEQLEHLTAGANSITMRKRIAYWRKMATQFFNYKCLYLTDAWDVLFFGTRQELIDKATPTFLCSAERNAYPEPALASVIVGNTAWKFCNNGMIAANPEFLLSWCDEAESMGELDILDQAWFNRRRAERQRLFELDVFTDLFYVVSATQEDGSLQVKDGRPYNAHCETFPCFLHFSGKCPADGVRQMLAEAI